MDGSFLSVCSVQLAAMVVASAHPLAQGSVPVLAYA